MPSPKQVMEFALLKDSPMEAAALKGTLAQNQNKDFVQRIASANPTVSNSQPNMNGSRSTHSMSSGDGYIFPDIVQKKGVFVRNKPVKTGEEINMGSDEAAEWMANNYKRTNPGGFLPRTRKLTDL